MNPSDKKWVYTVDGGKTVEVFRKVRGDQISIELKHPYVYEKTIKTFSMKDEYK